MAKVTLLEIVQDILSDADSDEVNSIADTIESYQCARIVRDCFRNIVDNHDVRYNDQLKRLDATSATTPCQMTRPAGLYSVDWVKYNKKLTAGGDPEYEYVEWLEPKAFIDMTNSRSSSDSNVSTMTLDSGHQLLIETDKAPDYYTMLQGYDDFIFDSYNSSLETNLQTSKSLVFGVVKPTLSLSDSAEPDLPEHLISLLQNDARAMFFDLYKDGVTREVDKKQRRSEVRAQRHRHITNNQRPEQTGHNYGRKRR